MALPTGSISFAQINTELGLSSTAIISLNDPAVRSLAGKSSGAISMSDLLGKSSVTFSPTAGAISDSGARAASAYMTSSQTAVWTYTKTSGVNASGSIASGGSATSFQLTLSWNSRVTKECQYTVTATVGSVSKTWTVTLRSIGDQNEL